MNPPEAAPRPSEAVRILQPLHCMRACPLPWKEQPGCESPRSNHGDRASDRPLVVRSINLPFYHSRFLRTATKREALLYTLGFFPKIGGTDFVWTSYVLRWQARSSQ